MLFAVISIAMAQPATMTKGQVDNSTQVDTILVCQKTRDILDVLILTDPNCDPPISYHFPNDSSLLCPMGWMCFKTNYDDGTYWHTWETSLGFNDYGAYGPHNSFIFVLLNTSCYIKVTVTDEYGNTGSDSIYFNIKNLTLPEDYEMEILDINGQLNAKLNFMPGYDLTFIQAWISPDSTNFIPYGEGWIKDGSEPLYPDNYYEHIFYNYDFNEYSTWIIAPRLYDTCGTNHADILPGMYLCTKDENNGHYLNMKTSLQPEDDGYVYTIFTVDSNGVRYPFIVNGGQVILPSSTTSYLIPAAHEHPYYQCAVAKLTDSGEYKILSYSNKVDNPWIDTTNIDEYDESDFQVYPNPSSNGCNVKGFGRLIISNILGQTILEKEINGQDFVKPNQGIYIFKLITNDGKLFVKKVIIEWLTQTSFQKLSQYHVRVFLYFNNKYTVCQSKIKKNYILIFEKKTKFIIIKKL